MFNSTHKLITESRQAGQAWFSIGKSMLTPSSPPLPLHVPKNTFQEGLLHDFSKECSGTEQPRLSQITLLTDGCSICLPLLWISCALCDLPKMREQPGKGVSQLPQHPGVQHIWLEGLHGSGTPTAAVLIPEPFLRTDLLSQQHPYSLASV